MFIVELIIFVSLAVILYLVGLALPRIDGKPVRLSRGTHWVLDKIEEADQLVEGFTEKFLRRVKVTTLRVDNSVSKTLEKFKKEGKDE